LKLALVTRRYPPLVGGAEKVVSYLAEAVAREGADVTVVTSAPPGLGLPARESVAIDSKSRKRRDRPEAGGSLDVVRLGTSRVRFLGTWLYMHNLRRWFARNPIDLAYVSMLKHDAYVALGAGETLGFPVVLRPEGAGVTGDIAWQSWGNFGRRIGRRCRRAVAFIAISKAIEKELETAWVSGTMRDPNDRPFRPGTASNRPRIVSIPNGVPVPEAAWQVRPGWRESPRAVFVGRLAQEKGLDDLIAAWPTVRASYHRAQLTLIGEGPERPRLEALARSLGLGDSVDLPGAAASDEVTEQLRQSDLFILPSHEEGMSVALLEAMALGIPVVASSISGNRRLVSDFKHGRLAPVDDPGRLAGVIVGQWADFDRAFHMSRSARDRVEREFSIAAVARKHLELFRQLIDEKTRAEK
jgi:glycosyltransferase involved in cell wall biosynthesis